MRRRWLSKLASGSTCHARFIRGTEHGDARFATASLSDQHVDACKKKRVAAAWLTYHTAHIRTYRPSGFCPCGVHGPRNVAQNLRSASRGLVGGAGHLDRSKPQPLKGWGRCKECRMRGREL